MESGRLNRRGALKTAVVSALTASSLHAEPRKINGNIKQSVCYWCYNKLPLETVAAEAKQLGYQSIELLEPNQIKTVKQMGSLAPSLLRHGT